MCKMYITIQSFSVVSYFFSGTWMFYNIHKFHHDPDYWGDPNRFRPDRFLDTETGKILRKDRFIPFGFGKRVCMGESLAKAEVFLAFVLMVKNLKFAVSSKFGEPDFEDAVMGVTRSPNPFYVRLEAR